MSSKVANAVRQITNSPAGQNLLVPLELYISGMTEMAERLHRLEQRTSKKLIRTIAEAAYQKQEQRLNSLRDECVRVLSLLRDKGIVTQDEINKAVRNG